MKYIYVCYALIVFVALFLLFLPFFFIFSFLGVIGKKMIWALVRVWAFIWFPLIGIFNKSIFEYFPQKNKKYVVIVNHQSFLDSPLVFLVINFFVRPLATAEYSKIPLFGFLYRQFGVLIDRKNPQSKAEGLLRMKNILKKESSIIIFPEGKFNESGKELESFYDGAFKLAIDAQVEILPILFLDSGRLWNAKSFWSLKAGLHRSVFLKPIHPKDFQNELHPFKDGVRNIMIEKLIEYR